jgi:hypothetical protein
MRVTCRKVRKDLHFLSEIRTHSVQRQLMMPLDAACPMKPPKTGPKTGPQNAELANTGKTAVLSEAVHMSEILPPAQTNGVAPKKPARKRNTS